MMTLRILTAALLLAVAQGAVAQPRYPIDKMAMEQLNRGVVAVRQTDGTVAVSWRQLRTDRPDQPFDLYRNGQKLNAEPMRTGGTFFTDADAPQHTDITYTIKTTDGGINGSYTLKADAPMGYLPVPIDKPMGGKVPTIDNGQRRRWRDDGSFQYTANDASVADVDGDGELEIVLKWEPTNSRDNSHDGFTGNTIFDCYRLSGQKLWRIDLGHNIRSGAHYVPFIVYDLDGDGRAEFIVKTADGTRDGLGRCIGDSTADYRNPAGRILSGPEYLTVFDGTTGRAIDSMPYCPERGDVAAWGDPRGNRSERYLAAVGYLGNKIGGKQVASVIFCRGYYTRSVLAAWDFDGKMLKQRWVFDTDDKQWADYAGQGNHNLRVADVDADGYDEITYGSMAVDHNGKGLYNTGFGHGDALHLMVFSPDTDRLMVWDCHENRRDGSELRDARTGEVIFQIKSTTDVGRCMTADIDPTNPGLEMWSTDSHGIRNVKGETIGFANDAVDPQHDNTLILADGQYLPVNFGIWWDGDLLRELLDRAQVMKYNWQQRTCDVLLRLDGCRFNNGTKQNPCLAADILGDWREEIIARTEDSSELRIFTTPHPTPYRINCLLEDIPYRLSVATQNVGYNQPSEPGFYLGEGMTNTTSNAASAK